VGVPAAVQTKLKNMKKTILWNLVALTILAGSGGPGRAQTTAFTYQGLLNDTGATANGTYDLTFAAYDAPVSGNLISVITTNQAVTVSNGLFTTTVDFGSGVFTGSDLWLEITVSTNGANTFATVAPRQQFNPVPYALFAQATAYSAHAGVADNVGPGVVAVPQLATSASPASGQVLAFDGTQLVWQDPVVGGSTGGWSLNGNAGTTGGVNFLGTTDSQPLELKVGGVRALRLEATGSSYPNVIGGGPSNLASNGVAGAVIGGGINNIAGGAQSVVSGGYQNHAFGYISAVSGGAYNVANGSEAFVGGGAYNVATNFAAVAGGYANIAGGYGAAIGGGGYDGNIASANSAGGACAFVGGGLGNSSSGYEAVVGGGQANVASGVDDFSYFTGFFFGHLFGYSTVGGGYANTASATGATVPGGAFNTASGDMSLAAGYRANAANAGSFVWADESTSSSFTSTGNNQFLIRAVGGVGINTASPAAALHVYNATESVSSRIESGGAINAWSRIEFANGNGQWNVGTSRGYNGDQLYFNRDGVSGNALALQPSGDATFSGNVSVCSLTIRGGCDLAEPFATTEAEIEAGSVVVIDPANPGQLKLSGSAYDTRVAGVVSGANGIHPGIAMHQEGALEGGRNVALSGRVYVQADAANGAIEPGDLLTTSDLPGRAMKVTDHARAQGAIIGKAMTGLAAGKGLVLVLVTLQ
jgi:hypothetical protein